VPSEIVVPGGGLVDFGGLGDALRLEPAAHRERGSSHEQLPRPGKDAERRAGGSAPADERGSLTPPKSAGGGSSEETLRGTRAPNAPPASTAPPAATAPGAPTPGNTETSAGDGVPVATGNGKGRGLGHGLPTPRKPVQPPPQQGGRPDPPALGHTKPSAPSVPNGNGNGNGNGKGHSK
jgi:hypothetical protein